MKQTQHVWYETLLDLLGNLDFHMIKADHSSFVSTDKTILIAVYIDDLSLFGADIDPCNDDKIQNLHNRFQMTDLGDILYSVGMEVDVNIGKRTKTF